MHGAEAQDEDGRRESVIATARSGSQFSVPGMQVAFYVYVLVNPSDEVYVGQTSNVEARLAQHNDPECTSTLHTKRHHGPWRLLYHEQCSTRAAAMKRERQLKSGGGRRFIRGLLAAEGGC